MANLLTVTQIEFQELYQEKRIFAEVLLVNFFSDDILLYCHQLPTYSQNADPYEFQTKVFMTYFDALERSNGFIKHSILTELKMTANQLAQNL